MRAIALLSGGLDSAVALANASKRHKIVLVLNFDYGQRSAKRETQSAFKIAKFYKIPCKNIKLSWLSQITNTALVSRTKKLPFLATEMLDDKKAANKSAKLVWVPNRNGVFVNIAASYAESMNAKVIITGFNAEEAQTFPDNSVPFMKAINKSLAFSTLANVKVESPTANLTKVGIVKLGRKLGVPFGLIWSCYEGGKKQCGECESCKRSLRAFSRAR